MLNIQIYYNQSHHERMSSHVTGVSDLSFRWPVYVVKKRTRLTHATYRRDGSDYILEHVQNVYVRQAATV